MIEDANLSLREGSEYTEENSWFILLNYIKTRNEFKTSCLRFNIEWVFSKEQGSFVGKTTK